jgi:serine/threonine-protein kinase
MKLVRGERFDRWARGQPLRARLRLFQRVCEAVAFAHARGVLHRDLKPENVMVGEFGEALVMDWGLARALDGGDAAAVGASGTPEYMAPEQVAGGRLDERTDVYGLGAILGVLIGLDAPPTPAAIAAVRDKAKAPSPAQRYAGARELGEDVGRFLELEPVLARRESLAERAARFGSRNRVVLSLLAAYVVVRLVLLFI